MEGPDQADAAAAGLRDSALEEAASAFEEAELDEAGLTSAIETVQGVLAAPDLSASDTAAACGELSRLHALRSGHRERQADWLEDLDAAISYARRSLPRLADTGDGASPASLDGDPALRALLGLTLLDRSGPAASASQPDAAAYRDEAIAQLTAALDGLHTSDPGRVGVAAALGQALHDRYSAIEPGGGNPSDLDEAIRLLLTATAEPEPDTVRTLLLSLTDRLDLRDDDADLDLLIDWGSWLLTADSADPTEQESLHDLVAMALLDRADRSPVQRAADLDQAIGHLHLVLATAGSDDRGQVAARIAQAYFDRLDGDASRYQLVDELVRYARQAWTLLPPANDIRPLTGFYLAVGLHEQLLRPSAPFDQAAVTLGIDVLREIEPEFRADPMHVMVTVTLGHFLAARGQATGNADDLMEARPWLIQTAAELADADATWSEVQQTLAAGLGVVAHLGMSTADLDLAIGLLEMVGGREDANHSRAALTLGTLGTLLIERGGYQASREDLDRGIVALRSSFDQAPAWDPYRVAAALNLSGALVARFQELGQLEDLDAARFYLATSQSLTGRLGHQVRTLMGDVDAVVAAHTGLLAMVEGLRGDSKALDVAVTSLRNALAGLPYDHPHRQRIGCDLGFALALRSHVGRGTPADLTEATRLLTDAVATAAGDQTIQPVMRLRAIGVLAATAAADGDQARLRQVVAQLTTTMAGLDTRFGARYRFAGLLGAVALQLYVLSGDPRDLDAAVTQLEAVASELSSQPFHPQYADCMTSLARAQRAQGQTGQSRTTGFAGLRGRARDLLLQSGSRRSLDFARLAADEAAALAVWCLADDCAAAAVEALELGRGMVLHAATSVTELTGELAASGHHELAAELSRAASSADGSPWDHGLPESMLVPGLLSGTVSLAVPDSLRAQALTALTGSQAEQRLLRPPSVADLAAALRGTGADALVYLLPTDPAAGGRALIIRPGSEAEVDELTLPWVTAPSAELLTDYLSAYAAAHTGAQSTVASTDASAPAETGAATDPGIAFRPMPEALVSWNAALVRLSKWAGRAVMGPLLRRIGQPAGGQPWLVLIPVGQLAAVPWHAARSQDAETTGGRARYALHDAVISYAASGRQLCQLSQRAQLPLRAAAAVVGDPTGTLGGAVLEAAAIADVCYPGARYLGTVPTGSLAPDGPGTPGEIRRLLPSATAAGASVLHLACHGAVSTIPGESRLILAGCQELRVDAILRHAAGRPANAAGGVVTLASCGSDAVIGHYDEALSPATAFLAAGAATVVAARWQLPDRRTPVLMFMFHYFLSQQGHGAARALRDAQAWLLDPDRIIPAAMPSELARLARGSGLDDPIVWAGVVHQGR